jgi:hypothetical protein
MSVLKGSHDTTSAGRLKCSVRPRVLVFQTRQVTETRSDESFPLKKWLSADTALLSTLMPLFFRLRTIVRAFSWYLRTYGAAVFAPAGMRTLRRTARGARTFGARRRGTNAGGRAAGASFFAKSLRLSIVVM